MDSRKKYATIIAEILSMPQVLANLAVEYIGIITIENYTIRWASHEPLGHTIDISLLTNGEWTIQVQEVYLSYDSDDVDRVLDTTDVTCDTSTFKQYVLPGPKRGELRHRIEAWTFMCVTDTMEKVIKQMM
jgi:hypothetical protein